MSLRSFLQRITVHNAKSLIIDNLRIVDRVPVSQDTEISIKLTSPALVLPGKSTMAVGINDSKVPPAPTKVADGIVAQWHGANEENTGAEWLDKDSKFGWVYSLPAQKQTELSLQWDVSTPSQRGYDGPLKPEPI